MVFSAAVYLRNLLAAGRIGIFSILAFGPPSNRCVLRPLRAIRNLVMRSCSAISSWFTTRFMNFAICWSVGGGIFCRRPIQTPRIVVSGRQHTKRIVSTCVVICHHQLITYLQFTSAIHLASDISNCRFRHPIIL